MRENRQYIYDSETKKATAYVTYNGITFATEATCHENDYDFESERTGLQIADIRANISPPDWPLSETSRKTPSDKSP